MIIIALKFCLNSFIDFPSLPSFLDPAWHQRLQLLLVSTNQSHRVFNFNLLAARGQILPTTRQCHMNKELLVFFSSPFVKRFF